MEKAIMISIRPEWVQKILDEKKTLEVRKSRPKLETPFKCYIYCTKPKRKYEDYIVTEWDDCFDWPNEGFFGGGLVVGEFVCDKIDIIQRRGIPQNFDYCYLSLNEWGNDDIETEIRDIRGSCIPKETLNAYAGKTPVLYAWHISNLQIYDTPKPINSFTCIREGIDGMGWWPMNRPPQSWGYVITEGDDADESRRNA